MGRILRTTKFTTGFEALIVLVGIVVIGTGLYFVSPGMQVALSKQVEVLTTNKDNINNVTSGEKLDLPSENQSDLVTELSGKVIRVAEYAWNGNSGMIVANGGPKTTEGSLMEQAGVNLEIVRQDMVGGLRDMQIKFVEEYDKGTEYPKSDKSAAFVSIMGDGAPFYITTLQKSLDEKFGAGKYHVQVMGAYGLSYGEDKVIGPREWKDNPQSMKGCLISSVIGDGDWVVACNYAAANGIAINPNPTTYDKDAINFVPSQDDDYINSVKELIKSQKSGYTIPLDEVVSGQRTGKEVNKKIDGCTTWTPGDKMAFDALTGFTDVVSTKEFVNQMATTIIGIKEWAIKHDKEVINILKQTYVGSNQIKQYDEWAVRASEAVAKTYNYETPKYWYDLFKGQKGEKNGLAYNVGGTRVFNYADAMQYYGITDGNNRYKAVYEQVSKYLVELNPFGFNESNPQGVIPYDDAVNLYFLKTVGESGLATGKAEKISYAEEKTTVLANGEWHINFASGSDEIQGSKKDLETIYNLLIQAEDTKLKVVGHTDNVGDAGNNKTLSLGRANSVVQYLTNRGISSERFQLVGGKGQTEPVADNTSSSGKAKNRRVEITLLK